MDLARIDVNVDAVAGQNKRALCGQLHHYGGHTVGDKLAGPSFRFVVAHEVGQLVSAGHEDIDTSSQLEQRLLMPQHPVFVSVQGDSGRRRFGTDARHDGIGGWQRHPCHVHHWRHTLREPEVGHVHRSHRDLPRSLLCCSVDPPPRAVLFVQDPVAHRRSGDVRDPERVDAQTAQTLDVSFREVLAASGHHAHVAGPQARRQR